MNGTLWAAASYLQMPLSAEKWAPTREPAQKIHQGPYNSSCQPANHFSKTGSNSTDALGATIPVPEAQSPTRPAFQLLHNLSYAAFVLNHLLGTWIPDHVQSPTQCGLLNYFHQTHPGLCCITQQRLLIHRCRVQLLQLFCAVCVLSLRRHRR
jgi:hypothetical protein